MGIADVCSHTLLDSEGLGVESMLRSKVSRAYLLTERRMVLPKICDDKRGFAKYLWKKLPEVRDNKDSLTLNTAELLLNMCDNHHCMVIVTHYWPSATNIWQGQFRVE